MRISTKGRHAVMAMVDIAKHGGDRPVPLADVAQRQMISLSYLEQLVAKLKREGLVNSMRGPGGGYLLARAASEINVQQIVSAVDVSTREKPSFEGDNLTARQMTDHLWMAISARVKKYLSSVTLDDVIHKRMNDSEDNGHGHGRSRSHGDYAECIKECMVA